MRVKTRSLVKRYSHTLALIYYFDYLHSGFTSSSQICTWMSIMKLSNCFMEKQDSKRVFKESQAQVCKMTRHSLLSMDTTELIYNRLVLI